jgi:hypothetical protein
MLATLANDLRTTSSESDELVGRRSVAANGSCDAGLVGETWQCRSCTTSNLLAAGRCTTCNARRPTFRHQPCRNRHGSEGGHSVTSRIGTTSGQPPQSPSPPAPGHGGGAVRRRRSSVLDEEEEEERAARVPATASAEPRERVDAPDRTSVVQAGGGTEDGGGQPSLDVEYCVESASCGSDEARRPNTGGQRRKRPPLLLDATCRSCAGVHCAHTCDSLARKEHFAAVKRAHVEALAMSREEAELTARQEGLTLVPASPAYGCVRATTTGYYGVHITSDKTALRKFVPAVHLPNGGPCVHLGRCATKFEAALVVARHLGKEGSRRMADAMEKRAQRAQSFEHHAPMSVEEARRLAAEEGLLLVEADGNASGFRGVTKYGKESYSYSKYPSSSGQSSVKTSLGGFRSAAEAALAYARQLSPDEVAEAVRRQEERARPPMTLEEAQRTAAAEGLGELHMHATDPSRFKGVRQTHSGKGSATRPFEAHIRNHRKRRTSIYLGCFASAPEAALAYARAAASFEREVREEESASASADVGTG